MAVTPAQIHPQRGILQDRNKLYQLEYIWWYECQLNAHAAQRSLLSTTNAYTGSLFKVSVTSSAIRPHTFKCSNCMKLLLAPSPSPCDAMSFLPCQKLYSFCNFKKITSNCPVSLLANFDESISPTSVVLGNVLWVVVFSRLLKHLLASFRFEKSLETKVESYTLPIITSLSRSWRLKCKYGGVPCLWTSCGAATSISHTTILERWDGWCSSCQVWAL